MKLQPSNQKNIHYRLRLYVHDALQKEFRKLLIITVESDVVAITLHHFFIFFLLHFKELSIKCDNDEHRRYVSELDITRF